MVYSTYRHGDSLPEADTKGLHCGLHMSASMMLDYSIVLSTLYHINIPIKSSWYWWFSKAFPIKLSHFGSWISLTSNPSCKIQRCLPSPIGTLRWMIPWVDPPTKARELSEVCLSIIIAIKSYHLVMTNSSPWKDPPIFKFGKPSISMGHLYHGELLVITRW